MKFNTIQFFKENSMKRLLLLIPCIALSACVYNQHTNENHKGTEISSQQVATIETGKTTKQWVLTNFGIPDRTQVEKDGLEVFEYVYERTQKSNKSFIFLFDIDSDKVASRKVTRIVMRDGIVQGINVSDSK
jgi:outer membrane protein assembly factor BamE (lipoprotein component of BamABCDE complex)